MNARRSSIRTAAIVLGGLLLHAGAASAQHGGGGHGGGGHYGGGHYGGSHYRGGGHYGGHYGRSHYRGYYGGHYYPRFSLYGGLHVYYGYPYDYGYGYPYYPYGGYRYGGGYGYGGYGYGGYEYDETGEYLDESGGRGGGELRLTVRPGDAVIYVDGEFRGPGRQVRRLELPPGRHSIEVVRPGYQTFERAVDVERDRPVDLHVELRPAGS